MIPLAAKRYPEKKMRAIVALALLLTIPLQLTTAKALDSGGNNAGKVVVTPLASPTTTWTGPPDSARISMRMDRPTHHTAAEERSSPGLDLRHCLGRDIAGP